MTLNEKLLLLDFYNNILEAERACIKTLTGIHPEITDEDLRSVISSFIRDESMNCRILSSLIKDLGEVPGNKTGDTAYITDGSYVTGEKLRLLLDKQEWVAKQIRYHRELLDLTSSRIYMEAMKMQHEENIDLVHKILLSSDL